MTGPREPAMRRRDFMAITAGAALAWPAAAGAQQVERMRRIAVLSALPADDPEWQARLAAFHQALQEHGWVIGRNVRIEYSVGPGSDAQLRQRAATLVALAPDAILTNGISGVQPLL